MHICQQNEQENNSIRQDLEQNVLHTLHLEETALCNNQHRKKDGRLVEVILCNLSGNLFPQLYKYILNIKSSVKKSTIACKSFGEKVTAVHTQSAVL